MLRKLTISAALAGILGLAAVLAPGASTSTALTAVQSDALELHAPVISNMVTENNNG